MLLTSRFLLPVLYLVASSSPQSGMCVLCLFGGDRGPTTKPNMMILERATESVIFFFLFFRILKIFCNYFASKRILIFPILISESRCLLICDDGWWRALLLGRSQGAVGQLHRRSQRGGCRVCPPFHRPIAGTLCSSKAVKRKMPNRCRIPEIKIWVSKSLSEISFGWDAEL